MNRLLLNPGTKLQLKQFCQKPSHALLIAGPIGSGRGTLARHMASALLKIEPAGLDFLPNYIHFCPPAAGEISIDMVRSLISRLKLKALGSGTVRRVVLIEDAGKLSIEAQNAMLKMLEEPPAGTVFILTAEENSLLPTIESRVHKIPARPVSLKDCLSYYKSGPADQEIKSNWQLSQGLPGLLDALLNQKSEHPLKAAIITSKKFFRMSKYERLSMIDDLQKDGQQLKLLLDSMNKVLGAVQHRTASENNQIRLKKIVSARREILKLHMAADSNVNLKLIGLELVLRLKI